MIATDICKEDPRGDQSYTEYFVRGTTPTESCTCHVKVKICNETEMLANEEFCTDVTEKVFITRADVESSTAWEKAKDAEYTLTIKENCTEHVEKEEPEEPEKPKEPQKPEKPEKPEENEIENNVVIDNNTVVDGNNTTVDTGSNVVEENTSTDGNVTDGDNTVTDNEVVNNTTE